MSNVIRNIILGNRYFDSLKLMRVSSKIAGLEGVDKVSVVMATDLNKQILKEVGLFTSDIERAKPDDLVVAVSLKDAGDVDSVLDFVNSELDRTSQARSEQMSPKTLESALSMLQGANLALISVPGNYAKRRRKKPWNMGFMSFYLATMFPLRRNWS